VSLAHPKRLPDACGAIAASLRSSRTCQNDFEDHFFLEGDPAGWLALANPPEVVAADALILSFLGFLASLLLRI
jgi:hypothetical protein